MSTVVPCPTCGAKTHIKQNPEKTIYTAIQDEEAFKKVWQLKAMLGKLQEENKTLKQELEALKNT